MFSLPEESAEKRAGLKFSPKMLELLSKYSEVELEDVEMEIGDLEIWLQPSVTGVQIPRVVAPAKAKPSELLKTEFHRPLKQYPGSIVEVRLGATRAEGGTRGKQVTLGGEKVPPFYLSEGTMPHPPIIALDVFDTEIKLAKAVRMHVEEVLGDPAEWARLSVEKFGADMVNLHLVSIDPLINDTQPAVAAKTVEKVLQAVDVPLTVGGCGDPQKDLKVFEKIAEAAQGERILFNSVTLDMDVKKTAEVIKKFGHATIAFTSMDMNRARELNRKLYEYLPREDIVVDTTTAALGYGLDYAFSIMERTRLAALMGDNELQHPMASGTTNAWAAREAWMSLAPEWGPRELRGPMWESVTALTLLLTGVDYFMMMHPAAVKTVREVTGQLTLTPRGDPASSVSWVTLKI